MTSWLYRLADRARDRVRRRRWPEEQASGRRAEDLAHRYLRKQGYTITARNYRPRSGAGEIDLIGWDRDTLVFIEVKARASEAFGPPDLAVDREKRARVLGVAREYTRRAGKDSALVRFDIVSVVLGSPPSVRLIRDAFAPERLDP
jgi:putative endonuclease